MHRSTDRVCDTRQQGNPGKSPTFRFLRLAFRGSDEVSLNCARSIPDLSDLVSKLWGAVYPTFKPVSKRELNPHKFKLPGNKTVKV